MQHYRPDIDGLRMLAITPVVLYHAGIPWLSGGFVGVDVFFVISGFLITGILQRELAESRFSLVGFYERRARRILPALFVVMFASFVFGWFLLLPNQFIELSKSAIAAALFSSNFWFWKESADYFAVASEFVPLLHTWSLAVEEQFYIVFPLLLWALARRSEKTMLRVVAALTALSFVLSVIGVVWDPSASFYLAPLRGWELGLGALLAFGLGPDLKVRWLREMVAMAGLVAILAAVLLYDSATPFPGLAALLPCLGAAALIAAGTQGPSLASRLLSLKPMVFIGLISYSLYLWHWPILAFLRIYIDDVTLPPLIAAGAVVAAFAAAVLSWLYVERPFRRRPPVGIGRPAVFASSGAATSLVIAMSAAVWLSNGMTMRLPPHVQLAYSGAEDANPDRERCFQVWPDSGLCRFGADAPVDFLLWGDSHAEMLMPGIAVAAREAGRIGVFAGRGSCAPLLRIQRVDKHRAHNCAAFNAAVFAELQARDDIPLVILAARWVLTAEGHRVPQEPGGPALIAWADKSDSGIHHPQRNFEIYERAVSETVAAIRATGRQVIILGNVPEIGWNVPRRLSSHLLWGHSLPPVPTIESVELRHSRAEAVLAEVAQSPGVRLLPLAPLLCDPVCRTSLEGRPLYMDGDHLSRYGAVKIIVPLFREKVWRPAAPDG